MPTKRKAPRSPDVESLRADLDAPLDETADQLLERASLRVGRQLFTVPQALAALAGPATTGGAPAASGAHRDAEVSLGKIVGALGAAPAPISPDGHCLLCNVRIPREQAAVGWVGGHGAHCAWRMAQQRKAQLADRLLAELERPAETPVSMALRLVASALANSHRQLDDAHFFNNLHALYELAGEVRCRVQLARQVQRAMRDDSALENRLRDWVATAEEKAGPHVD